MKKNMYRSELLFMARLFAVAAAVNFVWEMAQMPLYKDMPFEEFSSWVFCFRASLGDGIIVLVIWLIGYAIFHKPRWFRTPKPARILVLLLSGAAIAITVEIHAIATGRWDYSALMPLLPIVGIGLSPFIQLLILPILSMRLADRQGKL